MRLRLGTWLLDAVRTMVLHAGTLQWRTAGVSLLEMLAQ